MGKGVNTQILLGHLGRDPEMRYTQSGMAICNFSVATAERTKENGEWTDSTTWHNVISFGKTAEACEKYLSKGSQVYVSGRTQHRKWQDKEGNDRYSTEVIANDVTFVGGGNKGGEGGYQQGGQQQGTSGGGYDPNSEIPF